MSFFDEVAPPYKEPEFEEPVWAGPQHGVISSFSTQRAVLARTDSVLLLADRFSVYPNGVIFTLTLMRRERSESDEHGHVPFELYRRGRDTELSDDFVRLGLLFADGSKWTNIANSYPGPDHKPEGPLVIGRGGGGGDRLWEMDYWIWPLPPSGPLTFVVSWPAEHIAEQRIEIDAEEFNRLAASAEHVWPKEDSS